MKASRTGWRLTPKRSGDVFFRQGLAGPKLHADDRLPQRGDELRRDRVFQAQAGLHRHAPDFRLRDGGVKLSYRYGGC